jgi:DNA polymerase-1
MCDRLIVIDAYSQIFRMFYGIRGAMQSPDGLPTNAIYGMFRLLLSLDRDFSAGYAVAAFDKGKCATRTALQPDYKGTRKPTPEDLIAQVPSIRQLFELFGWNIMEKQGVEADDIVAKVVSGGARENLILSSDKDLMQLVNDHVFQLVPGKQGSMKRFDVEAVTEKFGVPPDLVLDYLALIGDSADNIPGVPGVGPKTAVKLLQEFGSISGLIAGANLIAKSGLREKVLANVERLHLNQKMIALYPEEVTWDGVESVRRKSIQGEALLGFARSLGFKSLLREVEGLIEVQKSPMLFDF